MQHNTLIILTLKSKITTHFLTLIDVASVPRLESLYCATEISVAQFRTKCAPRRANFGNIFLRRAVYESAHAKCYCAIFEARRTRRNGAQNKQHTVNKGETAPWAKPMKPDTRYAHLMCCYGWLDQPNLRL